MKNPGMINFFLKELEDACATDKDGVEKIKKQSETITEQLDDDNIEKLSNVEVRHLSKELRRLNSLITKAEVVSVFDFYTSTMEKESLIYLYEELLESFYYTSGDDYIVELAKAWGFAFSHFDPKDDSSVIRFKDGDLVGDIGITHTNFDEAIGLIEFFKTSGICVRLGLREEESMALSPYVYHDKLYGDVVMQVFSGDLDNIIRSDDIEVISKAKIIIARY